MDEPKHQAVESSAKPVATSPKRPSDSLKPPPAAPTTTTTVKSPAKESNPQEEDGTSDAETIVLHGLSPTKPRKVITIKHEEKSEGEIDDTPVSPKKVVKDGKDNKDGKDGKDGKDSKDSKVRDRVRSDDVGDDKPPLKKKRPLDKDNQHRTKDAASSGLSSVPASPPLHPDRQHNIQRRRRSSASESEHTRPRSPRLIKDKAKSVDRQLKRKAPKAESDDEDGSHKARRPRISDMGTKPSSGRGLHDKHSSRARSNSPHSRLHRRSTSTQLPAQSSNGVMKKRRPAPLMSTDYQSDDSSASGSPHPRSSRLKSIATPLTGDSTASPAKMHGVHKKHLDAHGQTLFAKACAKGEYDVAKMRLQERPEDLNFSDHAGNTPPSSSLPERTRGCCQALD
ncbi:ankyrin repeat protein [Apiospora arundinis]